MRKVALVVLCLLYLQALAAAEQESVQLGNYIVSFDTGLPKDACMITTLDPDKNRKPDGYEIVYSTVILDQSNTTGTPLIRIIYLTEYEREILAVPASLMKLVGGISDPDIDSFTLTSGSLDWFVMENISNDTANLCAAIHCIDKHHTITVMLAHPWNEGINQFIQSIRVKE